MYTVLEVRQSIVEEVLISFSSGVG